MHGCDTPFEMLSGELNYISHIIKYDYYYCSFSDWSDVRRKRPCFIMTSLCRRVIVDADELGNIDETQRAESEEWAAAADVRDFQYNFRPEFRRLGEAFRWQVQKTLMNDEFTHDTSRDYRELMLMSAYVGQFWLTYCLGYLPQTTIISHRLAKIMRHSFQWRDNSPSFKWWLSYQSLISGWLKRAFATLPLWPYSYQV
jgi:hypothetical protein